jgi:membrane fusion protein (multidrug efflux system)
MVRRDTISETIRITGRLVPIPSGSAILTAPADGVVRRVAVQVGERIGKDELLIDLDVPELQVNAQTLRANALTAAQEAKRQADLLGNGITSRKESDRAAAAATSAQAAADAAEHLLQRARVTSPLAGGVQRVLVHPGERVQSGQELAEVIAGNTLDLVASVPAVDLSALRVGQPATVTAEGAANALAGTVRAIAPAVDTMSNAAQVVIRVPNGSGILRAGSSATAMVSVGTKRAALVVPDSALVLVGQQMSVFVVGPDSIAHAKPVQVGVRQAGRAEVSGDLQPGDRVATTGVYGLNEGMQVVPAAESGE